jgi:ribosomal-protein-alanine N-acetyltransferase
VLYPATAIHLKMIRTPRLILRQWQESDLEPFAAMNTDSRVMEFFPALLSREESDEIVGRAIHHWNDHGFGRYAVEIPGKLKFAGFIGLSYPSYETHFTPCVEIGWRLAAEAHGQGYATEGAAAVMEFGFNELKLEEIVSFTAVTNVKSINVMKKLGMKHSENFMHPKVADGHPLKEHVLYRKSR